MRSHYCIAGVPQDFSDAIKSREVEIVGRTSSLFCDYLKGDTYTEQYVSRFRQHIATRVAGDHHNKLEDVAVAILFLDLGDGSDGHFKMLFPEVLCVPFQWKPRRTTQTTRRESANRLIAGLNAMTKRLGPALGKVKDELVGRSNRTPLLLPLRNFGSDVLVRCFSELHHALAHGDQPEDSVRTAVEAISHIHGEEKPRWHFLDGRGVEFHSPGKDRHGFARPGGGHPEKCLIGGRYRFGAPYDRAFHYDCTGAKSSRLRGDFFGCHEESKRWEGDPHLNIAPNDFVRG